MIALDHIALAAASLEEGIAYVRKATGVSVPLGGVHTGMGTHNALGATGGESYLEIIAPDPDQAAPPAPRAFGMDEPDVIAAIGQSPRVQTFLLRTDDIERDLKIARDAGFDLGQAETMTRGDLRWKIALRPDRSLCASGAMPILIEWPDGPHVSTNMEDQGLVLEQISVATPDADAIKAVLDSFGFADDRIAYKQAQTTRITARYQTPDGRGVVLGNS